MLYAILTESNSVRSMCYLEINLEYQNNIKEEIKNNNSYITISQANSVPLASLAIYHVIFIPYELVKCDK